ncbi:MAG: DUF3078 domain-containing protein [Bacteroidota bacterium]
MKNKIIIITMLFSFVSILASGQVTEGEKNLRTVATDTTQGWKKGGVLGLNLAQTSLKNWSAGGQNSVAVNGILAVFANLKQGKSVWDNSLNLGYGFLKQGENDKRKTDDKIDLLSKYGREAFKNFYYAALLNFKTQMTEGFNYPDIDNPISDLFAPAYFLAALGMDYKPNPNFTAFIAPLTAKFTFVADDALSAAGAFGVEPGEKSKSEIGGYIRASYTKNDFTQEFMKNIAFTTKIDLFSNYLKNPQNIDVSWETLIAMKINKYISVSLNTHLLYDDDIKMAVDRNDDNELDAAELAAPGSRIQFKEIFGVGFSYNF